MGVDYIEVSEVLRPADEEQHINKHPFTVPFVCGCHDLGEALCRGGEGAAISRTKGEAGIGTVGGVRLCGPFLAPSERVTGSDTTN